MLLTYGRFQKEVIGHGQALCRLQHSTVDQDPRKRLQTDSQYVIPAWLLDQTFMLGQAVLTSAESRISHTAFVRQSGPGQHLSVHTARGAALIHRPPLPRCATTHNAWPTNNPLHPDCCRRPQKISKSSAARNTKARCGPQDARREVPARSGAIGKARPAMSNRHQQA